MNPGNELLEFINESNEILEKVASDLLLLESNPEELSILDAIFRGIHTVKGTAGFFGLATVSDFAHHLEGMLDALRNQKIAVTSQIIDLTLSGNDYIVSMLQKASIGDSPVVDLELIEQFKATYQQDKKDPFLLSGKLDLDHTFYSCVKIALTEFQEDIQKLENSNLSSPGQEIDKIVDAIVNYGSSLQDLFSSKKTESELVEKLQSIKISATQTELVDPAIQKSLILLAEEEHEVRITFLETLIRQRDIIVANNVSPLSAEQQKIISLALADISSALAEVSLPSLALLIDLAEDMLKISEVDFLETLQEIINFVDDLVKGPQPIGKILVAEGKISRADVDAALGEQKALGEILVEQGKVDSADIDRALQQQKIMEVAGATDLQALSKNNQIRTMKVDETKVENFGNLIGEMLVSRNSYEYLLAGLNDKIAGDTMKSLRDNLHDFSRLVNDMHHGIIDLRMVPIKTIFQKFTRIVRDISRKKKKHIELVFQGEETEIDKKVADTLTDPMIHLIRNSCDHGIETPEVRSAAGKSEKGTITLAASQESGNIVIRITDDGAGINKEKLTAKAKKNGIDVENMEEPEILALIFKAGLSTMDKSTDLSGRGVGMDVVRSSIDALGGDVQVSSEPGKGTMLTLTIPASMGISTVLLVEICGFNYGLPFENVVEAIKIHPTSIHDTGENMMFHYRDKVIPVSFVSTLLTEGKNYQGGRQQLSELDEVFLVIIRNKDSEFGIIVDKFVRNMEIVMKPLPSALADIDIFNGISILGNGQLILIFNTQKLI